MRDAEFDIQLKGYSPPLNLKAVKVGTCYIIYQNKKAIGAICKNAGGWEQPALEPLSEDLLNSVTTYIDNMSDN